jgi:hypothetical protein
MNSLHELASRCEQALTGRQLAGGGWGYCGSRQWALEPTSLALLALRVRPGVGCSKAVHFLESCQRPDGSWPGFQEDEDGSWATAVGSQNSVTFCNQQLAILSSVESTLEDEAARATN